MATGSGGIRLHLSGVVLPEGEHQDLWVVDGVLRKIGITDRKLKKQLNTLEEYVAGKESRREARRRKQKLLQ